MYVPHAWLYRGLRSEGSFRIWTKFFTFEEKVKNNALNLGLSVRLSLNLVQVLVRSVSRQYLVHLVFGNDLS